MVFKHVRDSIHLCPCFSENFMSLCLCFSFLLADWFSPNSVHRLERQVVPHFFSGKSGDHTPEKYMECRNCIVAKYMENPEQHLSVAECRVLVTDVSDDDLTRIVRFLDHWGIINYCAAAPNREPQNDGTCLFEDSKGELCVPTAALKSIDSLIQFDRPKCRLKTAEVYPELASQGEDDSDFDSIIREHLSEFRCNYCSRPTPLMYYQSQKEVITPSHSLSMVTYDPPPPFPHFSPIPPRPKKKKKKKHKIFWIVSRTLLSISPNKSLTYFYVYVTCNSLMQT